MTDSLLCLFSSLFLIYCSVMFFVSPDSNAHIAGFILGFVALGYAIASIKLSKQ